MSLRKTNIKKVSGDEQRILIISDCQRPKSRLLENSIAKNIHRVLNENNLIRGNCSQFLFSNLNILQKNVIITCTTHNNPMTKIIFDIFVSLLYEQITAQNIVEYQIM